MGYALQFGYEGGKVSYMQGTLNGSRDGVWWQIYLYMGSGQFEDWLQVSKGVTDHMSKLFEIHRPSPAAIEPRSNDEKGVYFDVSVEPATDDGKEATGWDVSIACDGPRAFFEDRRATLKGVGDFIRDCAGTLIVEKFPVRALSTQLALPAPAEPVAEVPGGLATHLCEADFE